MNVDINLTEKTDAELEASFKELQRRRDLKSKLVSVLDRGMVGDRLHVDLPPDKYGEWVSVDKMDIHRMEAMGFKIDTEFAPSKSMHDGIQEGGGARVADVVFMICDREIKDLIDEIKKEQYEANNNPRGGKQKEERDFENDAQNAGLPSQLRSRIDSATVENIEAALTAKD